jgi:hypothetical protein
MRPRIFIGSSREGYNVATHIKARLEGFAECMIWDEGFFEPNQSTFETLSQYSVLFDFAIIVASADDVQLRRDTLQLVARDNIIFEFGLYVGKLGRRRAFLIKEKSIDLPSDLHGVTLPTYKTSPEDMGKTLDEVCDDLLKHMASVYKTYELSFIPSTVLAIGYYTNFVEPVCKELMETKKREVDGKQYDDFKLHLVVPDKLPDDVNDHVKQYLSNRKLSKITVDTDRRGYQFYLDVANTDGMLLEVFDMPTTLQAMKKAIELAIPSSAIGESEQEFILKAKELNNFCNTLKYLISRNAIAKDRVIVDTIAL